MTGTAWAPAVLRRRLAGRSLTFGAVAALAARIGIACSVAQATTIGAGADGTSQLHSPAGHDATLVIANQSGELWTGNFNPFSPSVNFTSLGIIYEPLVYVNGLSEHQIPWLAPSYEWSNGNRTLTFTIRAGVRWSDGKPFGPQDVVFTFNLMKRYPALDLQSVWSVLSSVRQRARNQVEMTFKQPAVPFFYYIADQTGIVPEHIWSRIKSPATFVDRKPVGTGPFVVGRSTPQAITYLRNRNYWQPGKPAVARVLYPAFKNDAQANRSLAEGKADWGGQVIPSIERTFVRRDPVHHHYWFPPSSNVDLYINQTRSPVNLVLVRQALAYAIDRQQIARVGEYGYEPPANQTGIVMPTFAGWYDRSLSLRYGYKFAPQKAAALLQRAGIKKGPNGMFQIASGKPLTLSVINVASNTDWVASLRVMRANLRKSGIDLQVLNLASADYNNRLSTGRFELAYGGASNGPDPYYDYRGVLYSGNTAPVGKPATSNYERWRSPETDRLLQQFAATTSASRRHAAINGLQRIMLEEVPVIPVTEGVSWFQWSTAHFTGWPSKANPYADPAPYATPDWEVVLTTVRPS